MAWVEVSLGCAGVDMLSLTLCELLHYNATYVITLHVTNGVSKAENSAFQTWS